MYICCNYLVSYPFPESFASDNVQQQTTTASTDTYNTDRHSIKYFPAAKRKLVGTLETLEQIKILDIILGRKTFVIQKETQFKIKGCYIYILSLCPLTKEHVYGINIIIVCF